MFKTTKAKVIFVSIFSIICILITTILILYKNIEIEDNGFNTNGKNTETKIQKDVEGINLKGTYNQNDLTLNKKKATREKVEISYLQIYGLKDKIIQDKINKELEQVALNFYKEQVTDLDKVINVSVNMSGYANFANTLSIEVAYAAKIDDNGDGFYQGRKGLNYDLTTGEKITVDKMFSSDAPIEEILRKSAYYSLIQTRTEDSLSGELIVSDYGNIEDEIALFMNIYKSGKIKGFLYTPKTIEIWYNEDDTVNIDMEKYAEYIAIYNRYLTQETIFEVNNIGIKNLYTLTDRYGDIYYYSNYQNESNYFIDISIDFQSAETDEFAKKLAQEKIEEIEKEIKNIKQYASKNTSRFYILNYYINIYTGNETSTQQTLTYCNEIGNYYEVTVNDFEENIKPIIINHNRRNSSAMSNYIYDFKNVLKIEPQTTMEYYNPETGEKVVI